MWRRRAQARVSYGDVHDDFGATSDLAGQAQLAAQMAHPFANPGDAEVATVARGRLHVESSSIVSHAQPDMTFAEREIDADGLRLSVSNRIGDGFLRDPEQIVFDVARQPALRSEDADRDRVVAAQLV